MDTIEVHGASLACKVDGSGPPLVLVHGSASDLRTWDGLRQDFARPFRTFAYSRRYHWPNAAIAEDADYAMAQQVDDLEALLDACDAQPAHLIGHSYGGFICLLLALRAPQRVRSLILIEPPVVPLFVSDPPRPAELLKLLLRHPARLLTILRFAAGGLIPARKAAQRGDMDTAMQRFGRAVLGADTYARLTAARREQIQANAIRAEFVGSGFPPLTDAAVAELAVPTMLVLGRESPPLFRHLHAKLETLLPNAETCEISGASHIVHEDNPAAFYSAALAFLQRQSQPASSGGA